MSYSPRHSKLHQKLIDDDMRGPDEVDVIQAGRAEPIVRFCSESPMELVQVAARESASEQNDTIACRMLPSAAAG